MMIHQETGPTQLCAHCAATIHRGEPRYTDAGPDRRWHFHVACRDQEPNLAIDDGAPITARDFYTLNPDFPAEFRDVIDAMKPGEVEVFDLGAGGSITVRCLYPLALAAMPAQLADPRGRS